MTSDETTRTDSSETPRGPEHENPATSAPAPKRPRRRATRTVGAPTDVVVVPNGGTGEGTPLEITLPQPAAERAAASGDGPALDVLAELADRASAAPARRSRRAARPAAAPDLAIELPTRHEAAQASPAGEQQVVAPPADAATEADVATDADAAPAAPRKKKATRSARAAGPAAEVSTEPAGDAPVRRTRRKTAAAAPAAAEPASAAEPAPAPAAEPASAEEPATAPATERDDAPAPAAQHPRLAMTALLFQAPDPTTSPRRSRRAQAPAGPPRPEQAAEAVAPPTEEPTNPAGASAPEAADERPAASRGRRRAARGTARAAASSAPDEPIAADGSSAVEGEPAGAPDTVAFVLEDLGAEDRHAIDEVELIERELLDEGVADALPEFDDLDFLDDEPETADVEDDTETSAAPRRRRRRGGRGRRRPASAGDGDADGEAAGDEDASVGDLEDDAAPNDEPADGASAAEGEAGIDEGGSSSRRRRRRRRGGTGETTSSRAARATDEVTALKGSTRLEAKRQRRREGRDAGRRRQIITEAEFLARRESVQRSMVVRERDGRTQIAVLEDGVLVEHYVSQQAQASMVGNVYLGRVQNVLPSMEAAFVDIGKGRNAVLYAGEVNWDAAGLEGQPRRIEQALKSGDAILVQVTKDPIGHKGARLTSQVTLAGRYLVFVPGGGMTGISRKLPDTERSRLKRILRDIVPEGAGVIVRTAAEGASEDELRADVARLQSQWEAIDAKSKRTSSAPALLQGEPDLAIRVVRDIFNDDFSSLQVSGDGAWSEISSYLTELAPDLASRAEKWTGTTDLFGVHRVDEQLAKGMDRKVWLPSGGSLVIDRTEAMTVVDVNTGKFTGSGGTLEETVTRNNLEAAEEIVRQLRLRDIGGIIVIDFIDMVLESNRDLVLRRLVECLGRDRTKHQVAEVTSLGLVQMTRKRVGQGLVEAFSETCAACNGRGFIVHTDPVERGGAHQHAPAEPSEDQGEGRRSSRRRRGGKAAEPQAGALSGAAQGVPVLPESREAVKATLATIAAAAAHAHEHAHEHEQPHDPAAQDAVVDVVLEGREEAAPEAGGDVAEPTAVEPTAPAQTTSVRDLATADPAQQAAVEATAEPALVAAADATSEPVLDVAAAVTRDTVLDAADVATAQRAVEAQGDGSDA